MFELVDPKGIYLDVYSNKEDAEKVAKELTKRLGREISVREISEEEQYESAKTL